MSYLIIEERKPFYLQQKVNEYKKEGYRCLGGMITYQKESSAVNNYSKTLDKLVHETVFCQTMELIPKNEKEVF